MCVTVVATTVITVDIWTEKQFILLLSALKDPRGVKNQIFFFTNKPLSFWAKIDPKLRKLQKIIKIAKKIVKKPCFQILYNLGSSLQH